MGKRQRGVDDLPVSRRSGRPLLCRHPLPVCPQRKMLEEEGRPEELAIPGIVFLDRKSKLRSRPSVLRAMEMRQALVRICRGAPESRGRGGRGVLAGGEEGGCALGLL